MKLTIETAKVYRLRRSETPGESFAWADITIRSWKNGGSIDAQSDYGSYAYSWNATGCDDIREFLVRLDYGYFMGKAHPKHGYETDWDATADEIKKRILEARREGMPADDAREAFDALESIDKDEGFFWQAREYPALHDFLGRHEYPQVTRRIPQCNGFWTVIWAEITKIWRQEMAAERSPIVLESAPDQGGSNG